MDEFDILQDEECLLLNLLFEIETVCTSSSIRNRTKSIKRNGNEKKDVEINLLTHMHVEKNMRTR